MVGRRATYLPGKVGLSFSDLSDGDVLQWSATAQAWIAAAAASVGSTTLSGLTDVSLTSPANDEILQYDSGASEWVNTALPSIPSNMDDLGDVNITSPADDELLQYNSGTSQWENVAFPSIPDALDDLSDVTLTSPSNAGELLLYDGTSAWINQPNLRGTAAGFNILSAGSSASLFVDADTSNMTGVFGVSVTGVLIQSYTADPIVMFTSFNKEGLRVVGTGIRVSDQTGDDPSIELWGDTSAAAEAIIAFTDSSSTLTIDNERDSGTIELRGHDSTSTLTDLITADPDGAVSLYYDGGLAVDTFDQGINVRTNVNNGLLRVFDTSDESVLLAKIDSVGYATLRNEHDGQDLRLEVKEAGGSIVSAIRMVSEGEVSLWYDGSVAMETTDAGIAVRDTSGSVPVISLQDDSGVTLGQVFHNGATYIRSLDHGSNVRLQGEDNSGTNQDIFNGDPDGPVLLYNGGEEVFRTRGDGVRVSTPTTGGNGVFELNNGDGDTFRITKAGGSADVSIRNFDHGGRIDIQSEDTSGTNQNLIVADPDGSVNLYHAGTKKLETTSAGAEVSGDLEVSGNVAFNGATPAAAPTYTPTNVTTDRSFDADSTTVAELADVLGTLIADLQDYGLLQ